jgi:hypothetical protein
MGGMNRNEGDLPPNHVVFLSHDLKNSDLSMSRTLIEQACPDRSTPRFGRLQVFQCHIEYIGKTVFFAIPGLAPGPPPRALSSQKAVVGAKLPSTGD